MKQCFANNLFIIFLSPTSTAIKVMFSLFFQFMFIYLFITLLLLLLVVGLPILYSNVNYGLFGEVTIFSSNGFHSCFVRTDFADNSFSGSRCNSYFKISQYEGGNDILLLQNVII